MKKIVSTIFIFSLLLFVCKTGRSQNAGINTDGTAPETGVMLDVKGSNAVSSTALQNIFQVKSNDASTDALKLRLGLGTNSTATSRYGVIDVPDFVGSSVSAYRPLAIQPLGGYVGIGTTAPASNLEVVDNDINTAITIINKSSTVPRSPRLNIYNYGVVGGGSGNVQFNTARGTSTAPTAVQTGDVLGKIEFAGYNGSGFPDGAQIRVAASENWGAGGGAYIYFITNANGTFGLQERMRIENTGFVGIGTTVPETQLHVANINTTTPRGIISQQSSTDGNSAFLQLRKSRGTVAAPLAVQNGDNLGTVLSEGYDGTAFIRTGSFVKFVTDGAIAVSSIPTALTFNTGSSGLGTERLRITSAGLFQIPLASLPVYANNAAAITGGLAIGTLYRTGGDPDVICVVH